MSTTQFTDRQQQAIQRVVERATANPEVRQLALTDPRAAVREFGNAELPAEATVEFVERAPDVDALIVMPPAGQSIEVGNATGEERELLRKRCDLYQDVLCSHPRRWHVGVTAVPGGPDALLGNIHR